MILRKLFNRALSLITTALLMSGLAGCGGDTMQVTAKPSLPGTQMLQDGDLAVEVMDPNAKSKDLYNTGVRFSPVAAVLQVTYKGKSFLFAPAEHNPAKEHGGLAMEFDLVTPPPGFPEVAMGKGFVKVGVGVLRKNRKHYNFFAPYEVIERPQTRVTWQGNRAIYEQHCKGAAGYGYKLGATVTVKGDSLTIEYRLTNSGQKRFTTEQYAHNFFTFDGRSVGPGYAVSFPYDYQCQGLKKEQAQEGRTVHFRQLLKKPVNLKVVTPKDVEGTALTVRHDNGMRIEATSSLSAHYTAIHAAASYVCPEPFIRLTLKRGETKTWTRTYRFALK